MIEVLDDVVPLSYQEEIKRNLLDITFPWFYVSDITYAQNKSAPAVSHLFVLDGQIKSHYWNALTPIAHFACAKLNYNVKRIVNARTFLQFPLNDKMGIDLVDRLHIDIPEQHAVVLYYVLDSDGDTIIVDKTHTGNNFDPNATEYTVDKFPILKKVTPKQGRVVVFDGRLYHTAEQPQQNMRCVININVKV